MMVLTLPLILTQFGWVQSQIQMNAKHVILLLIHVIHLMLIHLTPFDTCDTDPTRDTKKLTLYWYIWHMGYWYVTHVILTQLGRVQSQFQMTVEHVSRYQWRVQFECCCSVAQSQPGLPWVGFAQGLESENKIRLSISFHSNFDQFVISRVWHLDILVYSKTQLYLILYLIQMLQYDWLEMTGC